MQVSVEAIGTLERRMQVQVPAERIDKAINDRLQKLSRTVRLKGFRPGKVPPKIVRQQFGEQVRQEVLSDLLQQTYVEAITQEKLNPAGAPKIEPVELIEGKDLAYNAVFEVVPEIELKGIEGMAIERPTAEVTEADVDAMVQNLREQRATYEAVDRASADTDRVVVDFEGKIDGVAFDGGKGACSRTSRQA
jgi:trigger factor